MEKQEPPGRRKRLRNLEVSENSVIIAAGNSKTMKNELLSKPQSNSVIIPTPS
jgi:hypothetical protein